MAGVVTKGTPFGTTYKRTSSRPLDSSEIPDSLEQARIYAKNANCEDVPYPGQVITVNGKAYILKIDPDMPDDSEKGFFHCTLDPLGGNTDNDDRYVRRDVAETIEKLMTFLEGINAKGTSTLEQIKLVGDILSSNFATGSTGFGIYKDEQGNYHLDIDFVDIRKRLNVESLQVNQATYVGGKQYNSDGIICNKVEDKGTFWRCYFRTTDAEGRTIYNPFAVDDLANCETFNLKSGNHYYWRAVVGIGDDFIDLSKSDCISGSDDPLVGDNIVHLGNKTNPERQGTILWDSVTAGGPYIRIYKGINSYTMPEPLIDLNTVLSEISAKFINQATGKDVDETINDLQADMDLVKEQTDKEYTLWFFDYDPTLENLPASDWSTDELKTMHEQDMFYNRLTGHGYRFEKDGSSWSWNDITDHLTLKALEDASKAQDTADGKRRVFVSQPKDSDAYDIGDMWANATYSGEGISYKNDSLVCITAKAAGTAFSIKHWQPSSTATTAYLENLGDRILAVVTDSEEGIEAAKRLANQGISDAYDAAQEALNALGIARDAQETADKNTAVIQVTKDSIAALVEGIHFDNYGNITNINTSGLVTNDDFNVLLSKKITFDAEGHVSNISTSGLVTESGFTQLFTEHAEADGYVKRAEISTFITEDDAGRLISNAVISADQIRFNGNIIANDTFLVNEAGDITMNNITANDAVLNDVSLNNATLNNVTATSGSIGGFEIDRYGLSNYDNSDAFICIETQKTRTSMGETYTATRKAVLGNGLPGIAGFETASMFQASGSDENIAVKINAFGSTQFDQTKGGRANYAIAAAGGCLWKLSSSDDIWCMPGVLGCFEISTTRNGNDVTYGINKRWGNGINITGISLNSSREYWFTHDLGHTNYYPLVLPTGQRESESWQACFSSYNGLSTNSFNVIFWDPGNNKCYPRFFTLIIFGTPK
ncbi:hypothetical protein K0G90_23705 [Bacteroides thetaiotaomicron]|jgi:hypothetical protein|uniref:Uncharacterized protein n=1 Tax=Bacteroides thetaiotaomicron TaxID=818 RepID=A0AAW4Z8E4_BACT4|nr:hypothetical protein [Bacteroides thetaiotaomicron]MCE9240207.1 hypothetical protein [Bacteroides thetaiotaomicron]MCE9269466.1 hypothetical protein [Bacteroides thetaiotaomicron]MCE9279091.1 hypothetical protein [Bacteroides thetaiotaomicron]MCE9293320.1 hypothetical protein [Bacteroides thetaiotaomicron]